MLTCPRGHRNSREIDTLIYCCDIKTAGADDRRGKVEAAGQLPAAADYAALVTATGFRIGAMTAAPITAAITEPARTPSLATFA